MVRASAALRRTDPADVSSSPGGRLAHLPVTLFSAVMGLGGVALAWRRAAVVWDAPEWPFHGFLVLATLAFLVIGTLYAAKWVRHVEAARMLGVPPERSVVIEDAISGVQAGRAGGFGLVIGVARGDDPEVLRESGADIVVRDLVELSLV